MSQTGTVKKWADDKGFGFIEPTDGGKDIFVHRSVLPTMSHQLVVGGAVTYDIESKDGKPRACNVSGEGTCERGAAPAAAKAAPSGPPPGKEQGTVKKWFDEKGFGFIGPQNGGDDIFVLRSSFGNKGGLLEGGVVYYVIGDNPKNPGKCQATDVEGPGVSPAGVGGDWGGGGGGWGAPWGGTWGGGGGGSWGGGGDS
eukprot:Hpha_TRINITY_DN32098_c0_g1::TRINITY_DN32098_c0_g1_i1::g.115884::m.115884/K03704/cspA; cold shock protein (beta-ribbon, CspA family)